MNKMIRVIAFYLPQYYPTDFNDKWWEQGFTEWTNVAKAKPLFPGHYQPKLPGALGFYDLRLPETREKQAELAKRAGVESFMYWHYWTAGKKVLSEVFEDVVRLGKPDMGFSLCWANHSWIKSWEDSSEILIKQEYGSQNDWEKHFQYLLQFFKDPRYEKRDNKPLFMIFDYQIPNKEQFFDYLDKRCKDYGFDGIFLIETIIFKEHQNPHDIAKHAWSGVSRYFLREPNAALKFYSQDSRFSFAWLKICIKYILCKMGLKSAVKTRSADDLYNSMIKHFFKDEKWIHGLFFSWDNTPRHKERGYIIFPVTKIALKKYYDLIKDEDYLFINAWNEWAEGMILEPTTEHPFKYLEWIKDLSKH